jgi:hypothetical protein
MALFLAGFLLKKTWWTPFQGTYLPKYNRPTKVIKVGGPFSWD